MLIITLRRDQRNAADTALGQLRPADSIEIFQANANLSPLGA